MSEQLPFDTRTQTTAATATLTFTSTDGGPTLTIDFLGQYKIQNPRTPPTVVDIVVNEHPADEDTPALRLQPQFMQHCRNVTEALECGQLATAETRP